MVINVAWAISSGQITISEFTLKLWFCPVASYFFDVETARMTNDYKIFQIVIMRPWEAFPFDISVERVDSNELKWWKILKIIILVWADCLEIMLIITRTTTYPCNPTSVVWGGWSVHRLYLYFVFWRYYVNYGWKIKPFSTSSEWEMKHRSCVLYVHKLLYFNFCISYEGYLKNKREEMEEFVLYGVHNAS